MNTKFDEKTIQGFRESFDFFDVNKTGQIDREIMAQVLQAEGQQLEQLMTALLFEKYDQNKDGFIQFDEFIDFLTEMSDMSEVGILKQIFDLADKDKSNALDVNEVANIGRLMGLDISVEDAWATIQALDVDGNNMIDFAEFCQIIQQAQAR